MVAIQVQPNHQIAFKKIKYVRFYPGISSVPLIDQDSKQVKLRIMM